MLALGLAFPSFASDLGPGPLFVTVQVSGALTVGLQPRIALIPYAAVEVVLKHRFVRRAP